MTLPNVRPASVRRFFVLVIFFLTLFPAALRAGSREARFIRHGGAVPSEYVVALPDDAEQRH